MRAAASRCLDKRFLERPGLTGGHWDYGKEEKKGGLGIHVFRAKRIILPRLNGGRGQRTIIPLLDSLLPGGTRWGEAVPSFDSAR